MFRRIRILLLLACICQASPALADERILAYLSDIRIHENGELTITETIRVRSEGKQIRRGIFRDFPTRYRDRLGNHVNASFEPRSVLRNGETEPWKSETRSNGIRVYMGSADRLIEAGIHEYVFSFRTNRQLGFFEDHNELYFNVIGGGWLFPIDRAVTTLHFPFRFDPDALQIHVYSGMYGEKRANSTVETVDGETLRFANIRPLQPRESMTIAVGWPKGLIEEPGQAQKVRWFLADNAAVIVLLVGLLAPLGWYAWAWNKVGRDPEKGVIIPRFEAPAGLSPAACRYVKDMSFDSNCFTATIISLAVKKHLSIEEEDDEFSLERAAASVRSPLTKGERAVLGALLPRPGDRIEMKQENHEDFQAARGALSKALKNEYRNHLFHLNRVYLVPAIVMSVLAAILAVFFDGGPVVWVAYLGLTLVLHLVFIYLVRAPTPAGRRVMDEIEGLKMYLGTAERDRLGRMNSPEMTPEVFEAFLPFAYALGVENAWCERFAREMPSEVRRQNGYNPGWYSGRFSGMQALNHLGDNFSSSFSSAISSASSPPGSSSGSGGGGFSGGGGGGGGGGGW